MEPETDARVFLNAQSAYKKKKEKDRKELISKLL